MLTAKEIRRKFLEFFKQNGHTVVPSSSLVPRDDPSLLFTNAGMVQFKKLYQGLEKRSYVRAATSQKCLRFSGKHNDLENVGRTARHHTFFEMLGNFSFGDYFKEDAIRFAWTFVTRELKLPEDRLYVTVFRDDDEAAALWRKVAGLSPDRIFRMDEKDNFWTMGDTGPCGPCSEIYVDQGEDMACGPDCGIGKCDCDRFLEIWNLVFTQYDQQPDGVRLPLEHPNIDTGMGLERVAAVCQGKRSNFDCDLFLDIINYTASVAGVAYSHSEPDTNDVDTALRVIADHSRSAAFLIADGILPSNEGRGYVLRRLIRRALRFGTLMGLHEAFLYKSVGKVIEVMGDDYPELRARADFIARVVHEEEERFRLTLDKGLALLEDELTRLAADGRSTVPGEVAFRLYDTYGFPLDIVTDVAGFAAATYMRGLDFGFVSTTLLGQVDASVGGKNGVNVDGYKNMAGTFSQPRFVICDPGMLRTLSDREFRAGLAEVVKAAIIADADLFARIEATTFDDLRSDTDLLTDAVSASIRVKADIVERDERESGDRRKLNLGHTLAHAIEKCTNRLNHGEAVAVGTALIADASVKLGVLTAEDRDRIAGVLKKLGFDLTPPVDVKRLLKEVGKDKKNEDGMLRIVVPIGIGDCDVRRMSHDEFAALFA